MPAVVIIRKGGLCYAAPQDVQDKADAEAEAELERERERCIALRNKVTIDDDAEPDRPRVDP